MHAYCCSARRRPAILAPFAATLFTVTLAIVPSARAQVEAASATVEFPPELVDWLPYRGNPLFTAKCAGHWAVKIRERGWILRQDNVYHLWFTGYDGTREGIKRLGYATSTDGLRWTPSAKNPLCRDHWVEDVMVLKCGDTYYMFAEGADNNHAEMLTSKDRVEWKWEGSLDVRLADGKGRPDEPCGTPTIWYENGTWHLFYERLDRGVWLATSKNPRSLIWINIQDAPVLTPGPAGYDQQLIAVDQIIKYCGAYFAFYHASGNEGPPRTWNTNVARSIDLIHWQKFAGNPIVDDKSSGIVVHDGCGLRLYTMHDQIAVFEPAAIHR